MLMVSALITEARVSECFFCEFSYSLGRSAWSCDLNC